jgi:hypothetical protein
VRSSQLVALGDDGGKRPTWFGFFKRLDHTGSGRLDFRGFVRLVRAELGLSPEPFDAEKLKRAWRAIDSDGNHSISVGEFAKFARLGDGVLKAADEGKTTWKQKREARSVAAHAEREKEKDLLFNRAIGRCAAATSAHKPSLHIPPPA